MTLGERVFIYCERGTNEALWAEPINAVSNAGFFLAALIFWQLVLWRPPEQRSADHYLFIALVFAICFGSTAFHVYADRGTELADVIPIGLFMLVYFGYALSRYLSVPPGWTVFLVVLFAGLIGASTQIQCWEDGIGFAGTGPDDAKACLNGSVGYLPALMALIVISMLVAERRHKAAPYLLSATLVFAASILFRSLDMAYCDHVMIEGRETGTHFIWHILNAVVLFLLMRASLETEIKPEPEAADDPATEKAVAAEKATAEEASEAQSTEQGDEASDDKDDQVSDDDDPSAEEGEPETDEKASDDEPTKDEPSEDAPSDEEPADDESEEEEPSEDGPDKKKEPS